MVTKGMITISNEGGKVNVQVGMQIIGSVHFYAELWSRLGYNKLFVAGI
jgi:hypothetical protein